MVRRSGGQDGSGGLQPQRPQAGGGDGPVGAGRGGGQRELLPFLPLLAVGPRRTMGPDRGATLVELLVVTALAAVAMLGIAFFYVSSQATWLDGSTQAVAQREAGVIVSALTDSVRKASSASVF